MGRLRGMGRGRGLLPTQREVLRDVMLAAGKYGAWMTLQELARLTRYGEASISAQLRHLRRTEHGGYAVEKRLRSGEIVSSEEHFVVWEYRLKPRGSQRRGSMPRKVVAAKGAGRRGRR